MRAGKAWKGGEVKLDSIMVCMYIYICVCGRSASVVHNTKLKIHFF